MQNYESMKRLKELFRGLFQLDTADLDFGLYRLFRLKRAEIEAFLDKQLTDEVKKAFVSVTDAERESIQKQVEELDRQARESVADDAILPTGLPNPKYAQTKAVKEYASACRRLETAQVSEAQQAEVFNQLYAFFSRYYEDGDFIPRRFLGRGLPMRSLTTAKRSFSTGPTRTSTMSKAEKRFATMLLWFPLCTANIVCGSAGRGDDA